MFRTVLILCAFLFVACASHKNVDAVAENNYTKDSLLVGIERNPCFGRCPEYKAVIYKSGFAEYSGRRSVDKVGYYTGRIGTEKLKEIYSLIRNAKIEEKDSAYINPGLADYPSWSLWISDQHPTKHIFISHEAPPKDIKAFGNEVDTLLNSIHWTKGVSNKDE